MNIINVRIEAKLGTTIDDFLIDAKKIAKIVDGTVNATFNGIELHIKPKNNIAFIMQVYNYLSEQKE